MNQDEKLDEALKGTFPASDAFYLAPEKGDPLAARDADPEPPLSRASKAPKSNVPMGSSTEMRSGALASPG